MRRIPPSRVGALAAALLATTAQITPAHSANPAPAPAPAPAELLLTNGHVVTQDPAHPEARFVAIGGGRVLAVGDDAGAARWRGPATKVMDLKGQLVLPGFIDAHTHVLDGGGYLIHVGLRDARDLAAVQQRVAAYGAAHPGTGWILGEGWSYGYPDVPGGLPTARMLDAAAPDRPVYLGSAMAHAGWINSKAMALLGITKDTKDPPNGTFVRDAQGVPTGLLKEGADEWVKAHLPPPPAGDQAAALTAAMDEAARLGITRLVSAGWDWAALPQLAAWEQQGRLKTRFSIAYLNLPARDDAALVSEVLAAKQRYHSDWLEAGAVKMVADGVIESHTAWLPQGYADQPATTAQPFQTPALMTSAITRLNKAGLQVYVHAIGDGAIHEALDAFEAAQQAGAPADLRNRIEHLETPYAADMPRMARLGVIASMQPVMIYPKDQWMGMEGLWQRYAGDDRMSRAFALRQLSAAGVALAFSTDWPVSDLDPLLGIRKAVLRQAADGTPAGGWVPGETISVAQAIRAYTLGAAFASHRDAEEGSLTPGKLADIVVLSRDITAIAPQEIPTAKPVMTLVGGRIVYQR